MLFTHWNNTTSQQIIESFFYLLEYFILQQGLEIRGFWFQKKPVQLKTALREVYAYVLKGIFFQKTV